MAFNFNPFTGALDIVGAAGPPGPPGATTFAALTDVDVVDKQNGSAVYYNAVTQKYTADENLLPIGGDYGLITDPAGVTLDYGGLT